MSALHVTNLLHVPLSLSIQLNSSLLDKVLLRMEHGLFVANLTVDKPLIELLLHYLLHRRLDLL